MTTVQLLDCAFHQVKRRSDGSVQSHCFVRTPERSSKNEFVSFSIFLSRALNRLVLSISNVAELQPQADASTTRHPIASRDLRLPWRDRRQRRVRNKSQGNIDTTAFGTGRFPC